jgi:hypothetical protein
MAEPTSSSSGLLYLFIVLLGPLIGPQAFVLFAATLGAATALSKARIDGAWPSIRFLLLAIGLAMLFTVPLARYLVTVVPNLPLDFVMPGVAYLIGWKWDRITAEFWPWLLRRMGVRKDSGKETAKEAPHE